MATPHRKADEPAQDAAAGQHPLTGLSDFGQFRLLFADPAQERYEVARPLLLGQPLTAVERAQQTQKHPQTVRRYVRRFEEHGLRGLFDDEPGLVPHCGTISEAVRREVLRLKTLYPPLHLRETANIIYATMGARIDYKTVQRIVERHPIAQQPRLPLPKFHDYKDPYQARLEVIKLYYRGWNIRSISGFLGVSRQHIYNLLERFGGTICWTGQTASWAAAPSSQVVFTALEEDC